MAVDIGKAQSTINLVLILGIIGLVIYAAYKMFGDGGPFDSNNPDNKDPATGQSIGPLNMLDNWLFPEKFPGGGESIGTSETYTGAAEESLFHPITTIESIFGYDGAPATSGLTATNLVTGVPAMNPKLQADLNAAAAQASQ